MTETLAFIAGIAFTHIAYLTAYGTYCVYGHYEKYRDNVERMNSDKAYSIWLAEREEHKDTTL